MSLIVVVLVLGCNTANNEETNPNIILILADDMGYGDAGVYNSDSKIPTPNIDRIALEGIRLTDAHSPSAVCTPTRYGVLTGRYSWRTDLKSGVLWGYSTNMIDTSRVTIPSMLQDKGYFTGGVGKWHLGLGEGDSTNYFAPFSISPINLGFDYYYGIPASLDMQPYVYFENNRVTEEPTAYVEASAHRRQEGGGFWRGGGVAPGFRHIDVLSHTTEKATSFIEEQAQSDNPFFLYMPLSAPHTPWLPEDAFRGKSGAGYYGDFTVQVDHSVGQILSTLDELSLVENTLIIFTSDNGAHWYTDDIERFDHRANLHLRGQKADIWEGGHRVPFVARWPGTIKQGSVNDETVTHTDFFATIAEIVGFDIPEGVAEDSYNILPVLLDSTIDTPIREATVHHSLDGMFAIRKGEWKFIEGRGSGGFTQPRRIELEDGEPQGQLFNLAEDPSEQNNVYTQYPEIVDQLQTLLNRYKDQGYSVPRSAD